MAKKAVANIEIDGSQMITIYRQIILDQKIFGHHEFQIQVPVESLEGIGKLSFKNAKELIGKPIKIQIESEQVLDLSSQVFKGIILDVQYIRSHSSGNDIILKGASPTILLDSGAMSRSFSEKKLEDIVKQVLSVYPENHLSGKVNSQFQDSIDYVVEYQESDFHFLNRLANSYNEWFYYNGVELVFGQAEFPKPIKLVLGSDLYHFNLSLALQPINYQLQVYDYQKNESLESNASESEVKNVDAAYGELTFNESEALFSNAPYTSIPIKVNSQKDLDKFIARKRDQQLSQMVYLKGTCDNISLGIGLTITIYANLNEDFALGDEGYGEFIVTSVKHSIIGDGNYQNQFIAIPKESKVPPSNPYLIRPICDPQPAVVKENHDPDGLGRIKVQLYWQKDGEMTPWIRVVSTHGGGSGGFFVVPEKGDEVMVEYEDNNPDKPFIMGSLYHGKAKPGDNWQSKDNNIKAIKTKSGNEIVLNDEPGKEEIKILNKGGGNSITLTMSSGGSISISSKGPVSVSGTSVSISASEDLNLTGENVIISAKTDFKTSAGSNIELTSSANTVIESSNCSIHGSSNIEIKADSGLSAFGQTSAELGSDGNLSLNATSEATLKGTAGAKVTGAKVDIESQGVTTVKGSVIQLN